MIFVLGIVGIFVGVCAPIAWYLGNKTLREITASVPELVEFVRGLPCTSVVLDGETLALTDDGGIAVAQGQTGVALLGRDLKPMPGGEIR